MAFLAAAAPIAMIAGSVIKGVGGLVSGLQNKKMLDRQAAGELTAAEEQERLQRQEASRTMGAQLAAQWSNGMEGGSGTALDALRESEIQAALDAKAIRQQGVSKATSLQAQGRQQATKGAFALAGGLLDAASGAKGMSNDWAQARTGTTPPGSRTGPGASIPISRYG